MSGFNFYLDSKSSNSSLEMLEVYRTVPILKKLPLDIECIHGYDDYLLVGTKQGHLLMYKICPKPGPELRFDVNIQRSNKSFAKKPIVQIAALPDFHILISLSDNVISVHGLDPVNFPLITSLSKTKGATLFVTDVQKWKSMTGEQRCALRMCVVVKRKLLLFYWKKDDFHELAAELAIPDTPKVIAWSSESLVVGFRTEYNLIKVTGEQKELFPLGKHPEPIVGSLEGNRFALGRDENTYVIDSEGTPTLKYPIPWSDYPLCLVDDSPYLVALLPNSVIEIQTMEPRLSIQKIKDLTGVTNSKMKQLIKSTNKKGQLFVAGNNDVFCLVSVPFHQQIPQLLRERQFELALQLANLCDERDQLDGDNGDGGSQKKEETIQRIENLHAFDLFCKKEFKVSMGLFLKLDTDPSLVIGLLPDLLPEDYRSKIEYPEKPPEFEDKDLKEALLALIDYLLQVRRKLCKKTESQSCVTQESSSAASSVASSPAKDPAKSKLQLRQIIDTTLLKCYLRTNDALVSSLLRLPDNHCHLEETEKALKRFHKYNELIILYQSKGLHPRALDLLRKQSKKSDSHLFGHERTIQYLQHLGRDDLELIFEYAEWVLKEHPEDGLKIFTEDIGPETEFLPREVVLKYLEKTNPDLAIPYLEHIVWTWNEVSSNFHNTLVHKYREKVRQLLSEYMTSLPEGHAVAPSGEEPGELGPLRRKLITFLETSDYYSTEILPSYLLNDGLWDERAVVMGKIGNHEEALTIYVHVLKDREKAEDFCKRMYDKTQPGNRDVFLTLLKLYISAPVSTGSDGSPTATSKSLDAETRCAKDPENLNFEAAIQLLSKHATKIDPMRALMILPPSWSISSVKTFLGTVTKHLLTERREGQIFRNLLLSQHLQVQSQRIRLQQAHKIVIEETDLCRVCHKRIGKSAFLRFPNNHLVHYSCKDKYNLPNNGQNVTSYY